MAGALFIVFILSCSVASFTRNRDTRRTAWKVALVTGLIFAIAGALGAWGSAPNL